MLFKLSFNTNFLHIGLLFYLFASVKKFGFQFELKHVKSYNFKMFISTGFPSSDPDFLFFSQVFLWINNFLPLSKVVYALDIRRCIFWCCRNPFLHRRKQKSQVLIQIIIIFFKLKQLRNPTWFYRFITSIFLSIIFRLLLGTFEWDLIDANCHSCSVHQMPVEFSSCLPAYLASFCIPVSLCLFLFIYLFLSVELSKIHHYS